MSWLDNNPVGKVLLGICGALLVMALLLTVVWSLPPTSSGQAGEETAERPTLEVPELAESEPIEAFAVISERPVFNVSRQPVLEEETGEDELEDELAEEDIEAPEVQLAGVVITPSLRMATLRPEGGRESLIAFEGQPLKGNFGSWQVSRITERRVTLSSAAGEEVELELLVHDQQIAPPPTPVAESDSGSSEAGQAEDGGERQLSRAEEIRQRIAERREELRRAAEEANQNGEAETMDYRTAIQSMISGKNKKNSDDRE